jgi:dimethylhistidine N-methyltransferase
MDIASKPQVDPAFRRDVLAGLSAPVRAIPARWLYDHRGSELFEEITGLPEYYLTRADADALQRHCPSLAQIVGEGRAVVEFGSGSSAKTPILLRSVKPSAYLPIDISGEFLRQSADALQEEFPGLTVHPIEADFMRPIGLPQAFADVPKLGFFPGSTIGNMVPPTAVDLLRAMRETLGVGAWLLIGMDRAKDIDILLAAYDDSAGVTAAFNLNLLERINRELGGDIPMDAFRHRAVWNGSLARIEMHLEALRPVAFEVAGTTFSMNAGETIHTENSHKYGSRDARLLLTAGGWTVAEERLDGEEQFALYLAKAEPLRFAP